VPLHFVRIWCQAFFLMNFSLGESHKYFLPLDRGPELGGKPQEELNVKEAGGDSNFEMDPLL